MLDSDVITGDRLVMEKSVTASEATGDGGRSEDPFGLSGSRKTEDMWNERFVSQTHVERSIKPFFTYSFQRVGELFCLPHEPFSPFLLSLAVQVQQPGEML